MDTRRIVQDLLQGKAVFTNLAGLQTMTPAALAAKSAGGVPAPDAIPKTLDQLDQAISQVKDLSITAAAQASIPVVGSVSGGYDRRVIVLERTAFKALRSDSATYQYGYAIRLCVTTNKLSTNLKITLPFLAASAEVGSIDASFMMQTVGLGGGPIDKVSIVPTELNVETFVLAKQSLTALISAVRDPATVFTANLLATLPDTPARAYSIAVEKAYAIAQLSRGRKLSEAIAALHSPTDEMRSSIAEVYRDFAGISDSDTQPSTQVQAQAAQTLDGVKVDVR